MPTLEWIGKDKVINHHQEVPYRLFDRKYTYGVQDSENMIIHGDNLLALKSLLPQYQERIDSIKESDLKLKQKTLKEKNIK